MKKNFLIYVEDPRFGGPHQFTLNILDFLKSKYNVSILLSKKENKIFLSKIKKKNIKFDTLNIIFLTSKFSQILKYLCYFFKDILELRSYLKKNSTNIIYSISGFYSLKIIIASLLLNKKIIIHFHDTFCNYFFLKLGFFQKFFIDLFIFSSMRSYSFYKNFLGKRNYLVTQSFIKIPKSKKNKIKKKQKKGFDIVSISNINPVKRIHTFLDVAKKLNKTSIRFHIIGKVWESQKNYNDMIMRQLKEKNISNLFFYNRLNSKDIKKTLSKSDLYLCLSEYESSPMSIWEAMSYSLPIISSDVGDLKEFNKKFSFGYVLDNETITDLDKKILKIYSDKNLRDKFGNNSKNFVLNKIDLNKNIKNFQDKIFEVCTN